MNHKEMFPKDFVCDACAQLWPCFGFRADICVSPTAQMSPAHLKTFKLKVADPCDCYQQAVRDTFCNDGRR